MSCIFIELTQYNIPYTLIIVLGNNKTALSKTIELSPKYLSKNIDYGQPRTFSYTIINVFNEIF